MNDSKYIVDSNGERCAGCCGNAIRYGVGGGVIALLLCGTVCYGWLIWNWIKDI